MAEIEENPSIRLVIVARRRLDGDALAALCQAHADFRVICATTNADSALLVCQHRCPDVVLFDAGNLGFIDGQCISTVLAPFGAVPVVVVDDDVNRTRLAAILELPRVSYMTRLVSFETVADLIRRVVRGERKFGPDVFEQLQQTPCGWKLRCDDAKSPLANLTKREIDVLRLIALGKTVKDCAVALGLSPSTVDNHKSRLMKKLGVHRAIELTHLAVREGLVAL